MNELFQKYYQNYSASTLQNVTYTIDPVYGNIYQDSVLLNTDEYPLFVKEYFNDIHTSIQKENAIQLVTEHLTMGATKWKPVHKMIPNDTAVVLEGHLFTTEETRQILEALKNL
jgi:hypothetical protein